MAESIKNDLMDDLTFLISELFELSFEQKKSENYSKNLEEAESHLTKLHDEHRLETKFILSAKQAELELFNVNLSKKEQQLISLSNLIISRLFDSKSILENLELKLSSLVKERVASSESKKVLKTRVMSPGSLESKASQNWLEARLGQLHIP